jgi:hypothetical protein
VIASHAPAENRTPSHRFAWLLSFAVTAALVVLLMVVRTAQAAPVMPGGPSLPSASFSLPNSEELADESEGEEEAEEEGDDELEEAWAECEELEEGEEQEACETELEEEEEQEALEECTLSETSSTVVANTSNDMLQVTVHYRAYEPGKVGVDYKLKGGKGALKLSRKTSHFSRKGVFHDTRHLSSSQMTKVLAAHQFTVEIEAVDAPGFCEGMFDEDLNARRHGGSGRVWSD